MGARGRGGEGLRAVIRIGTGLFWLYFASRKWAGVDWMRPLLAQAAVQNPIPGLHELLVQVVMPNWLFFALVETAAEILVGLLLVLGLLNRWAAWGGVLLAALLTLTVGFLEADLGRRWVYYLAVLVNLSVVVGGPGALAAERVRVMPRWLRS
jgi:uncharacterized membrane protein YphA (DoxX/SURF4 family)